VADRIHLSGLVICQDNAATIGPVIDTLVPFCDEIVVVDGGSSDATVDIAAQRPKVRLFERPFDNHANQKNFACDRARGSWILILDSDELLCAAGLRRLRWLTHLPGAHWFSLPRYWLVERNGSFYYLAGRPYYRDRQLRMFRNEPGFRYEGKRHPIHNEFCERRGFGRPLRIPHIFHYALLLQSRAERERKFRRYMAVEPGSERLHRQQLWEDHDVPLQPLPEPLPGMLRPG
jgi:glycosyltransferase involved in cell wall biosynthesis